MKLIAFKSIKFNYWGLTCSRVFERCFVRGLMGFLITYGWIFFNWKFLDFGKEKIILGKNN